MLAVFAVLVLVGACFVAPLLDAAHDRRRARRRELDRVGRVRYPPSQAPGFGPRPTIPPRPRHDPSPRPKQRAS